MPAHAPRSLRNGLLGYWPVVRSPAGYVRDHSPEGNHGIYGFDARWIWFTNPRAVRYVGEVDYAGEVDNAGEVDHAGEADHISSVDRTYVGYIGGRTGEDVVIASFDHDTGTLEKNALDERFSPDDHTNPSVLVRSDGHVLVFWTAHNGDAIFYRISTHPADVTVFEPLQTLEQGSVTYPNPVWVEDGDAERLYLFYRDRTVTTDETDSRFDYVGDGHVYYRSSVDGGETWSDQRRLVTAPSGHYGMYFVPVAANDGTIHIFFTDAERGGDAPKWNVMHCCFRDGTCYRVDGTELATADELPLTKSELEVLYDSSAPGNHDAWIWDAGVDADGHPAAVYATFESTLAHRYRYVRWDGDRWRDHHVVDAGRYVARRPIELHYSAGVAMDSSNPDVLYAAVTTPAGARLERLETDTGGRTWASQPVTRNAVGTHCRPVVPQNASPDVPVLWLAGSYEHLDASQTVLRGLPTDAIDAPTLRGDGHHGVSLGLDLYPDRAFRDGLSLSVAVATDDPSTRQTVAEFGGMIRLALGEEIATASTNEATDEIPDETAGASSDKTSGTIAFSLVGDDGRAVASWDGLQAGTLHVVEGAWDGEELRLLVDGDVVDATPFEGPIRASGEGRGWTLMKDEYLSGHGLVGQLREVRLYNRALTPTESEALAALVVDDAARPG